MLTLNLLLMMLVTVLVSGCAVDRRAAGEGAEQNEPPPGIPLRAVTYNIRHARGMDGAVDLARTADVLRSLDADLVALQEVDDRAARSGGVDQATELAQRLGMRAAFGPFMDYQGGRYGMAILSRYPFAEVQELRLPDGHEPRIALVAHVRLPNDEIVTVVNVHFDWVDDDTFRVAQAQVVAEYLRGLQNPFVLLGDFNDQPGSRTHRLFSELAKEAVKPETDRFTFSSTDPTVEIDAVFTAPAPRWTHGEVRVHDEPVASDHRPVSALLLLHPAAPRSVE
jgi:endonuclease/exonuclease/phosphatase family metal-dependent hydrolase